MWTGGTAFGGTGRRDKHSRACGRTCSACRRSTAQERPGGPRALAALDALLADTDYAAFPRVSTLTQEGEPFDERNLVVLSRYPILAGRQSSTTAPPRPSTGA
jgi:hypothetical protein